MRRGNREALDGELPSGSVVRVVGGASPGANGHAGALDFPRIDLDDGETPESHVVRVSRRVEEMIAAGCTHLRVPREAADWLSSHPYLADHLAGRYEIVTASPEAGIVFDLRAPVDLTFSVELEGWRREDGSGIRLRAPRRLVSPRVTLRPSARARGRLRGTLRLAATKQRTLRIEFVLARSDRRSAHKRQIVLSLARPGFLFHDLPLVEVEFVDDGTVRIEYDLKLEGERSLEEIGIEPIEEDNWRVHPNFPGGHSITLPDVVPAGSRLELLEVALWHVSRTRKAPARGVVLGGRALPCPRPPAKNRDAVIFSSWVTEKGLALGDTFIETLCRWHADSKIFVGINHGSSPRWRERLEASGLDVTIQSAPATITMLSDPTGFVAALDAYRRQAEPFDLVWFAHTKGADHLGDPTYDTARWTIERMFWSRRPEIAAYFANPMIGLYAPHYLMLLQAHLAQTDALQRIYRAVCQPLGVMAVATHFVMRDESVRAFCADVDPRFFIDGPEAFGGDRYFCEMAMPNVPLMQGYEPYIESGLGGTSGSPKLDGSTSILRDWRQNNAVVAIELEKWRRHPTRFRTLHREHLEID